jgi:hypothetical protein
LRPVACLAAVPIGYRHFPVPSLVSAYFPGSEVPSWTACCHQGKPTRTPPVRKHAPNMPNAWCLPVPRAFFFRRAQLAEALLYCSEALLYCSEALLYCSEVLLRGPCSVCVHPCSACVHVGFLIPVRLRHSSVTRCEAPSRFSPPWLRRLLTARCQDRGSRGMPTLCLVSCLALMSMQPSQLGAWWWGSSTSASLSSPHCLI